MHCGYSRHCQCQLITAPFRSSSSKTACAVATVLRITSTFAPFFPSEYANSATRPGSATHGSTRIEASLLRPVSLIRWISGVPPPARVSAGYGVASASSGSGGMARACRLLICVHAREYRHPSRGVTAGSFTLRSARCPYVHVRAVWAKSSGRTRPSRPRTPPSAIRWTRCRTSWAAIETFGMWLTGLLNSLEALVGQH